MAEDKKLIMLPGPTNVPTRIMKAMTKPTIGHRSRDFHALHEKILKNLKYLFQTRNDVYALTSSGTGGIECAISNTTSQGDKVIIPTFGLFGERLKETIATRGGNPIPVPAEWGKGIPIDLIERAIKKNRDAKAIAIVYNETSTGVTFRDLPKLGKIAEKNNLLLIVDAISILGGDELPTDKWGVDICVTGVQKCLACPPGLALISVSEKAWQVIEETKNKKVYYFDLKKYREYERIGETPFTPALPLFYALDEALKMIREEGLENKIKRHRTCARAFYNAIEALKLQPLPDEEHRSNTVIAIKNPRGVDDKILRRVMEDRHRILIAGGQGKLKGSVHRIGNMGTVSEREVTATIAALEKALKEVNYPVEPGSGTNAARKTFSQ
ncbi:MAG: alanine--glyoxylate aminotransferase family protein [Candidatus Bathyarchaeota archaeon]|nr:alanine--glyoxylate aminotransferase family protein [Candidatus Bathyarchaeota archaeon]